MVAIVEIAYLLETGGLTVGNDIKINVEVEAVKAA